MNEKLVKYLYGILDTTLIIIKPNNKCMVCIIKLLMEIEQLKTSKKEIANNAKTIIQIILSPFNFPISFINYKLKTHSLNILPRS